ncbi:hypothetical protein [Cellulomonas denverensis]|uniref:Terminase small subunit n=1 Tax=Cellulomonas denverensis TaxID=264297 RepID=A0A7X6QYJ6_9CELL|nr:hypothetical protein [Cellulomonas denverensis]NKY22209.1 hypothetical protein [Cellulomonas denverensis]GIG27175.1 hypothetical protein Cde04nite_34190 [Cellulomonas denverensis]
MTRGGARNRSGPQADPKSGRSDRRGFSLTALPNEGYRGEAPDFPLPPAVVIFEYFEDKQKVREVDQGASESRREREAELWEWAWRTPQAAAWARESWRWQTVAMWVRTSAICESPEATAADKNALHRFADQIGMTPAGLKENGWAIAAAEIEPQESAPAAEQPKKSSRSKLKVVNGGS